MAWTSLGSSLGSKPRVLAGPILRKVTPSSVTVWLALRKPGTVTLTVLDDKDHRVMEGTRKTVAIGQNLHMVAVTAKLLPPWILTEGIVYRYKLIFNFDDGLSTNLATATANADIAYPPFSLPSFCLPPKDLNSLRLIQGSCRMPHAEGKDAFPLIDDLIAETASNAFARPHQLLLTGDQIYADDVAASMLVMLTDAADTLLVWKELLPLPASEGGPQTAAQFSPYVRFSHLSRGFTSVNPDNHLMSLGEYLCMYLFVWSDVLWEASAMPSFADILANVKKSEPTLADGWEWILNHKKKDSIKSDIKALTEFRKSLSDVRRALANIPSYMIFDDHEVTDDWNMTLNTCLGMYNNNNPLGRRIVQNALVAYTLCQHWGNAPEQFEDSSQAPPGLALLRLLDKGTAATYDLNSPTISSLVGVPNHAQVKTEKAVFHDPNSLLYNFTVEGDGHQIIFTDTRTWRSFPRGGNEASELLPKDQLNGQILGTPPLGNRALLVVLTTNAPAVQPIRAAARHVTSAQAGAFVTSLDRQPDVYEAWEIPSVPFDRLLKTLTSKLPKDRAGQHYGRAILLSGDVHHSFATRLIYRATKRFEDQEPQPATAVIAQLVASSFKKQDEDTRGFQDDGYTYAPKLAHALKFIPAHKPEGYVGWNVPVDSGLNVGKRILYAGAKPKNPSTRAPISRTNLNLKQPTVALWYPNPGITMIVELSSIPDYRYRLDYLTPLREDVEDLEDAPKIAPPPSGTTLEQRKQAAQDYKTANAYYRRHSRHPGKEKIIGVNNFGEITFDWAPGDNKAVRHTLRWHAFLFGNYATTYRVSLNPNDGDFPDMPDDGSNP